MTNILAVLAFLTSYILRATSGVCQDIDMMARVVFGEARGQPQVGQLAVAYTIVNRKKHRGYPNTLHDVVYAKYNKGTLHQYNTLDVASHTEAWEAAKAQQSASYQNAVKAARDALCGSVPDPTGGATDFCAHDPCTATNNNCYYKATNKLKIGGHYFVSRVPACE